MRYDPAAIEKKWQNYWESDKTFAAPREPEKGQKKMYVLDMFPYPSAEGLHVGHPEGYTATDIVCRFERMNGTAVLHPMGWDAFGLPAEQKAKQTGTHPRTITESNVNNFRRQLKMLGFSYDWDREFSTTDIEYFRWTQFIFLVLFDTWYDSKMKKGRPIAELPIPADVAALGEDAVRQFRDEHRLAYQIEAPVNWCPALGTVLANEEVIGGRSERGNHPVVRMPLRQWMLRITAYAQRLEDDLDGLDWSESIKLLQRNWIGRSTGAEVDFFIGQPYTLKEMELFQDKTREEFEEDGGKVGVPTSQAFDAWTKSRQRSGFPRKPGNDVLRIYTTRPDTLYGATYMVIAPEHPVVERLTFPKFRDAVNEYCQKAASKSDLDRTDLSKEKTGVFTGSYAINPVNGKAIPIWIADYVLSTYGTGAIMSVPAHDTRDFEFATQFQLPIVQVVKANDNSADNSATPNTAFTEEGTAINSGDYDGLSTQEFKEKISADLQATGIGVKATNFKLRDWLFSRQHFWGEPFPILHELDENGNLSGKVRALTPEDLPIDIPKEVKFDAAHNSPEPPLEQAPDHWLYLTIDGKKYKRETNTMPQWAGSCWYYLRFIDPKNEKRFVDPELEKIWMPVDLYVGGAEHAVLHLLYARFWHKVLYDRGYLSTKEPFQKLVNQGMILGEVEYTSFQTKDDNMYRVSIENVDIDRSGHGTLKKKIGSKEVSEIEALGDDGPVMIPVNTELTKVQVNPLHVVKNGNVFVYKNHPTIQVEAKANKMSKSRGNVINPDDVVQSVGADTLRLYEMFMGPLEATKPWSTQSVIGLRGFLDRVWRMICETTHDDYNDSFLAATPHPEGEKNEKEKISKPELNHAVKDVAPTEEQNRMLHKTIKFVTDDVRNMSFNTAIAKMMEFTNFFTKQEVRPKSAMEKFVLLLAPFAPHIGEELWEILGHEKTLTYEPWPTYDESATRESAVEVPISINGKIRSRINVPVDTDSAALEAAALADPKIVAQLEGKNLVKKIIVPGKMVNLVVK